MFKAQPNAQKKRHPSISYPNIYPDSSPIKTPKEPESPPRAFNNTQDTQSPNASQIPNLKSVFSYKNNTPPLSPLPLLNINTDTNTQTHTHTHNMNIHNHYNIMTHSLSPPSLKPIHSPLLSPAPSPIKIPFPILNLKSKTKTRHPSSFCPPAFDKRDSDQSSVKIAAQLQIPIPTPAQLILKSLR